MSITSAATSLGMAAIHLQQEGAMALSSMPGAARLGANMFLADGFLTDFKACLPPGFADPMTKVLGWVKAIALLLGLIAMWGIGRSFMKQQGDGMPDRDQTTNSLYGWAVAVFIIAFAGSMMSALGMDISSTC
ncbi:hypothetical protein [Bifidobacterium sp. H6bp9]|uniref:hypothetical protein n=1 Tax=Bifidobacterium sp. H6bp9 TaxID=3051961 RepID=UPI0028BED7FE|nr:hypothetical protein [Bifidobacterium sp. H6bp9]MDT7511159.1 hypothetical protein [Bifidobacterium sp. H6bp9]